jgi:phosphate transport system substrate-binding protein
MKTHSIIAALLLASASPSFAQPLSGAGATAPNPVFRKWFADYRQVDKAVKVSYQATGSGTGIQKISDGSTDFGVTEDPMTDAQMATAKTKRGTDVLHFPIMIGGVVPIYHVPGITGELNFTPAALAGIYLGKITYWDDPAIKDPNPGAPLRHDPITVVHRSDASGATFLWTEFLSTASPEWKAGPGQGLSVKWPVGLSVKGNEGLIHLVENTWDAIGFVDYSYARVENLPHGRVRNAAGVFVAANADSLSAAAGSLSSVPSDMRASFVNPPTRTAYPIAGVVWMLVPQKLTDPAKQKALSSMLRWMLTEGQKSVEPLGFAHVPANIVQRELARVDQLGR